MYVLVGNTNTHTHIHTHAGLLDE